MPEFPEVYTIIETLKELTLNKKIIGVDVLRTKNVEGKMNDLIGSTITNFSQIGKFIIFHFDTKKILISHLRMEGKYFLKNKDEPYSKHDIVGFYLNDNSKLIYNDVRKFGILKVSDEEHYLIEEPLSNVGPNPFMMKDASRLYNFFKNKNEPIKTALLNQKIMSGLGNIYVDEVLFECCIHPETPANLVNFNDLERILEASKIILSRAIKQGGTTIKTYHPKEGVSGNFQISLKVYGKSGKPCPKCHHSLRKIFVNGRGTTYCPKCQKNPTIKHVIGITGPIGNGKSSVLKYFNDLGYKCLSADKITHDLYKEKRVQEILKKIIPSLKIVDEDIDRDDLRNYLIKNPDKKKRVEKCVHSLVSEFIIKQIKQSKDNVAMEVPLLFESHLDDFADEIIYVDCAKSIREKRLMKRDKHYKESLLLNCSYNENNKEKATLVINNNGTMNDLIKKLNLIYGK